MSGAIPAFTQRTLSTQAGAAYLHPADLDRDGAPEFLLTTLSEGIDLRAGIPPVANGGAYVLSQPRGASDPITALQATKVFDKSAGIGWPNESRHFDLDGDAVDDWIIGAGFLLKPTGKIVWMKGSPNGSFGSPQEIDVPDAKCWYHVALPVDMDGDRDNDFVTSCHVGSLRDPASGPSRVKWFENDGKGGFDVRSIGEGGGALLSLYDLDQDGDQDVIAPQAFGPEAIVWYEQTGPKGTAWVEHVIDNETGLGFIVKFADMNGDGKLDLLYGNHNNEEAQAPKNVMGVYWFEIPPANKVAGLPNWHAYRRTIYEGFEVDGTGNATSAGAPGMINVGDIDGDCDMDVTVSGDSDTGLYLLVQQAGGFEKLELSRDRSNVNSGEQHMVDLDLDGDLDIVWAVFGPSGASLTLNSHVYAFIQE